jgi:PKHD-type hydroxylase
MKSIYSWPFEIDNVNLFAFADNVFLKEECEKIIKIGKNENLQNAKVGRENNVKIDKKLRKSKITWLNPSKETNWIFEKICFVSKELNQRYFNFDIFGAIEGIQFTTYQSPSGNYGKHTDNSHGSTIRKLSISIQLSDPNSYIGGELCLYNNENPIIMPKKQGQVIMFPSYVLHEVKPVTKGERISLVVWLTGKQFK